MINVLHVLGGGRVGGVELFVRTVATHIDRSRFALAVCIVGTDGALAQDLRTLGVRVKVLDAAIPRKQRLIALYRHFRAERPDILHASIGGTLLRSAARLAGCRRIISHVHGPSEGFVHEFRNPTWRGRFEIKKAHIYGADKVLACSRATAKPLLRGGRPPSVEVLPYGIETEQRQSTEGESRNSTLRNEWGLSPGIPVIGFVGRLVPQKGVDHLVDALEELQKARRDYCTVIVGDGPLRGALEAAARARNCGPVVFAGESREVPKFMSLFTLLVVPSEWEAFGIVALEAMMRGKPVVAFRIDGVPEVVADGETGLLVAPYDAQAMAAAISGLLDRPAQAAKMGEAGRKRVERLFSASKMVKALEGIYEGLAP